MHHQGKPYAGEDVGNYVVPSMTEIKLKKNLRRQVNGFLHENL